MSNQIEVSASDLSAALQQIGEICSKRTLVPILAGVRLTSSGDAISMSATDLDRWATVNMAAAISGAIDVIVDGPTLRAVVKRAGDRIVTLRVEDGALAIRHSDGWSKLPTMPVEDWPPAADDADKTASTLTVETTWLREALAGVSGAASPEEIRYYLNVVHAEVKDGQLHLTATDGHRLHTRSGAVKIEQLGQDKDCIIPIATVKLLQSLKEDAVTLSMSRARLIATTSTLRLYSRMIDGSYPDWRQLIPSADDCNACVHVSTSLFVSAVDAVSVMVDKSDSHLVTMQMSEDCDLVLHCKSSSGESERRVTCEMGGLDFTVGVNGEYIAQAAASLGCETIYIRVKDKTSPVWLQRGDDDTSALALVMPMRV